jgi:hypothetical protein
MTRMEPSAWIYRKSYSSHDWSNSDHFGEFRRISKNTWSKSIGQLMRRWFRCKVWGAEVYEKFKTVLTSRISQSTLKSTWESENLRTWELEDMRIWGYEDLRIWGLEDMRIITLVTVSQVRVDEIIFHDLFRIHDITFNSNDLRYLSCHGDFNSNQSIKSVRDYNFIPNGCQNIICDENFAFNITFYYESRFWSIT